jgi:hypothetical protein
MIRKVKTVSQRQYMGKQSLFDKANQLVEYAKNEKNPVIRGLLLDIATKYYGADISRALHQKPSLLWSWTCCISFYVLVSIILYMMVKESGLWATLTVMVVSYIPTVLAIGTILRMRGDITERGFIGIVREGFKTIVMLTRSIQL